MPSARASSFIDAAKGLAPRIQASAEEIEQSRRLPLPLVEAMAQAGLFRLWIPRALGGEEADPMTLVRVVEEVSRADGAAGWCMAIGGEYGAVGGYLPAEAAREIYGSDPHVRTAGAFRPFGDAVVEEVAIALPADGHWAVVVSIPPGSSAAAGSWTVSSHASDPMAVQSPASCSSLPQTARSSTPGTVSGCAVPAAMTMPLPTFLFPPLAHCRLETRPWSRDRYTRYRRSHFSRRCWRWSLSALRDMP